MAWLPEEPLAAPRQSIDADERTRQPDASQAMPDAHSAAAAPGSMGSPGLLSSERHDIDKSQSAQLESIAEQEPGHENSSVQSQEPGQEHALENGHGEPDHDGEQYETLTFHVAGKHPANLTS